MGITASSMACLRPLFQAFLSRSQLLSSSNSGLSVWKLPRVRYMHSRDSNGMEGFSLQGNIPKAFQGNLSPVGGDLEAGRVAVQASNASTKALTQENGWNVTIQSMTDESGDEVRRFHSSGGVTMVHAEK
jgi:hypothetical protein